jgi:hypothetical protein
MYVFLPERNSWFQFIFLLEILASMLKAHDGHFVSNVNLLLSIIHRQADPSIFDIQTSNTKQGQVQPLFIGPHLPAVHVIRTG